jgi:hypothetical protein
MAAPMILVSTFKVKEGSLEELRAYYDRLIEIVEAMEPRIIGFHGFLSEDGTEMASIQIHQARSEATPPDGRVGVPHLEDALVHDPTDLRGPDVGADRALTGHVDGPPVADPAAARSGIADDGAGVPHREGAQFSMPPQLTAVVSLTELEARSLTMPSLRTPAPSSALFPGITLARS